MEQAREWLQQARRIAVLTGAGISAESGIPTFRGAGGLWREYRAEDLATPAAFARDPKLVWEWYEWRRSRIAKAEPNAGHLALVQLEEMVKSFTLVTQNVDGLHARAGSRNILYLHGDIWTLRCIACGLSYKNLQPLEELPPRCSCGGMQRPGVVWFGEGLPEETWREADQAVRSSEVFLVIGTSAVVMPAGGLVYAAKQAGARVIEINAAETQVSPIVDCAVRGEAGKILPELLKG
ncbi:MAG TPA: NAD-dependent deacylase [Bryobacteraceae bacterium]|nr:NAD-dependent deacylase [Bryobacteraceae bacterium]